MVEGLDIRVFMGFTDGQVPVDFVEGGHAFFADGIGGADWRGGARETGGDVRIAVAHTLKNKRTIMVQEKKGTRRSDYIAIID